MRITIAAAALALAAAAGCSSSPAGKPTSDVDKVRGIVAVCQGAPTPQCDTAAEGVARIIRGECDGSDVGRKLYVAIVRDDHPAMVAETLAEFRALCPGKPIE